MKRVALFLVLMAATVGVVLADGSVPFPFFQHGFGVTTFWSVANEGAAPAVVTIELVNAADGATIQSTTATIQAGTAWLPDTGSWDGWYTSGPAGGFGRYSWATTEGALYLWGCVYGVVGSAQAGFTLVMPGNPYGL